MEIEVNQGLTPSVPYLHGPGIVVLFQQTGESSTPATKGGEFPERSQKNSYKPYLLLKKTQMTLKSCFYNSWSVRNAS